MGVDLLNRICLKKGKKITMSIASSNVIPKTYYNYSKNYNEENIGYFIGDLLFGNIHISSINDNTASLLLAMEKVNDYLKEAIGKNYIDYCWENKIFEKDNTEENIKFLKKSIEIFEKEYFSENENGYYLVSKDDDKILKKALFNWEKLGFYRMYYLPCKFTKENIYFSGIKSMSFKKALLISKSFEEFIPTKIA
jgi:hypothetical protein